MTDAEYEKQILQTFDLFGQALYVTFRRAIDPSDGTLATVRQAWRNVGKQSIKLSKEDIDA